MNTVRGKRRPVSNTCKMENPHRSHNVVPTRDEYLEAKRIVRTCEQIQRQKKLDSRLQWQIADGYLNEAAVLKSKIENLTKLPSGQHLLRAIPVLRNRGQEMFEKAKEIRCRLSTEELLKLAESQKRNEGASCFDDLITRRQYEINRRLEAKAAVAKQVPCHPRPEELCAICLDNLSEAVCSLSCLHIFHQSCLGVWLSTHDTCPICRNKD
jgi:hypothetical protein